MVVRAALDGECGLACSGEDDVCGDGEGCEFHFAEATEACGSEECCVVMLGGILWDHDFVDSSFNIATMKSIRRSGRARRICEARRGEDVPMIAFCGDLRWFWHRWQRRGSHGRHYVWGWLRS